MDMICDEFKIHVIVNDLECTSRHSKFRVNGKKYFGTDASKAKRVIKLNSFKDHYFIEEHTKYTIDYITHKYILHENIDDSNSCKRYDRQRWVNTSEERLKGHFRPSNHGA